MPVFSKKKRHSPIRTSMACWVPVFFCKKSKPPEVMVRYIPSIWVLLEITPHEPNIAKDGGFDKIINYTRNVIIRTHGDYFSQTKAASGLNRSIGCVEILYGL